MAKEIKAGRMKVVLATLLLFGPALLLILISTRGCDHKFKVLDDYGSGIDYEFTDARGKRFTSKDFQDHIVLVTTMQNSCPDTCALSFWHLKEHIYETVYTNQKKLGDVVIVSFVTDAEGNPVEDLSQVNEMIQDQVDEYNPNIWMVASGSIDDFYEIKSNGKTLREVAENDFGDQTDVNKLMLLLDKENHLRIVLPGNTEGLVRRMKEHIALLMKQYDKEKANGKK